MNEDLSVKFQYQFEKLSQSKSYYDVHGISIFPLLYFKFSGPIVKLNIYQWIFIMRFGNFETLQDDFAVFYAISSQTFIKMGYMFVCNKNLSVEAITVASLVCYSTLTIRLSASSLVGFERDSVLSRTFYWTNWIPLPHMSGEI
jgi:hypothetical protein